MMVSDNNAGTLSVKTIVTNVNNGVVEEYEYSQSATKANTTPVIIEFNNAYSASTQVEGGTSATITGTKTLTGRPLVDKEFTFKVYDKNGEPVSSTQNDAAGNISFTIDYTIEDLIDAVKNGIATKSDNVYKFNYTVKEDNVSNNSGVSIIDGEFNVIVQVTDNGNGKLTAVVTSENPLEFKNAYGQSATAEISMNGQKVISSADGLNKPTLKGGEFNFTITGSEGAPMPASTTVSNDASGNIHFGLIEYTMQNVFGDNGVQTPVEPPVEETPTEQTTESDESVVQGVTSETQDGTDQSIEGVESEPITEDGALDEEAIEPVVSGEVEVAPVSATRSKTFTYTISESGSLPGVTNDSNKTVNVTVKDNGDGTISVTSDPSDGFKFTFNNTYSTTPIEETSPTDSSVSIKKTLDGRDLQDGEFTFVMKDANGKDVSSGKNDKDGNVILSKISFDKPGIYTYEISELVEDRGGITYDSSIYKAIATVTDNSEGQLTVEWSVTDGKSNKVESIEFKNAYSYDPTSITLGGIKTLDGRDLADKEFLFELKDKDGKVIETVYNDKTGKITFTPINYEKAGSYDYIVSEVNNKAKGITYDTSIYNVHVDVKDNLNGTLSATTSITKDGKESSIIFNNKAEKDSVPEQPEKPADPEKPSGGKDNANTATQTYAGMFVSMMTSAASLAGILAILKKRREI